MWSLKVSADQLINISIFSSSVYYLCMTDAEMSSCFIIVMCVTLSLARRIDKIMYHITGQQIGDNAIKWTGR
jgi:hypothetical protein